VSEPLPLDIHRVLNLEQENMHLRAMISNRDSEIYDLQNQLRELQSGIPHAKVEDYEF